MYKQIDATCESIDNYDDGDDTLLAAKQIAEIKAVLHEAEDKYSAPIRDGHVIIYFGELSIAWHCLDRMLMITAFPEERPMRLDYGSTPLTAPGQYRSEHNVTGETLATRLAWLYEDYSLRPAESARRTEEKETPDAVHSHDQARP